MIASRPNGASGGVVAQDAGYAPIPSIQQLTPVRLT
jgi:hypothetical protein